MLQSVDPNFEVFRCYLPTTSERGADVPTFLDPSNLRLDCMPVMLDVLLDGEDD